MSETTEMKRSGPKRPLDELIQAKQAELEQLQMRMALKTFETGPIGQKLLKAMRCLEYVKRRTDDRDLASTCDVGIEAIQAYIRMKTDPTTP